MYRDERYNPAYCTMWWIYAVIYFNKNLKKLFKCKGRIQPWHFYSICTRMLSGIRFFCWEGNRNQLCGQCVFGVSISDWYKKVLFTSLTWTPFWKTLERISDLIIGYLLLWRNWKMFVNPFRTRYIFWITVKKSYST